MRKGILLTALAAILSSSAAADQSICVPGVVQNPGTSEQSLIVNPHSGTGPGEYLIITADFVVENPQPTATELILVLKEQGGAVVASQATISLDPGESQTYQLKQEVTNLVAGSYAWEMTSTNANTGEVSFQPGTCLNILPRDIILACQTTGSGGGGGGIETINGDSSLNQTLAVGSSSTLNDLFWDTSTGTHTLHVPNASATARGVVSTGTQYFSGDKAILGDFGMTGEFVPSPALETVNSNSWSWTVTNAGVDLNVTQNVIVLESTPHLAGGTNGGILFVRNLADSTGSLTFQDRDVWAGSGLHTYDNDPLTLKPGRGVWLAYDGTNWNQFTPTIEGDPVINTGFHGVAASDDTIDWYGGANRPREGVVEVYSSAPGDLLLNTAVPNIRTSSAKEGQIVILHNLENSNGRLGIVDSGTLAGSGVELSSGTELWIERAASQMFYFDGTVWKDVGASSGGSGGSSAFSDITAGVNQNEALTVGDGSVLAATGTGVIRATDTKCTGNLVLEGDGDCVSVTQAGVQELNGLTDTVQALGFVLTGNDPNWSSSAGTHTLQIPAAGTNASSGLITNITQFISGDKGFGDELRMHDDFASNISLEATGSATDSFDPTNHIILLSNTTGSMITYTSTPTILPDDNGTIIIFGNSPSSNAAVTLQEQAQSTGSGINTPNNLDIVLQPGDAVTLYYNSIWNLISPAATQALLSLNGQTAQTQTFANGTSGTDANWSSAAGVHTLNLPDASPTARGLVSTGTQEFVGDKEFDQAYTLQTAGTLFMDGRLRVSPGSEGVVSGSIPITPSEGIVEMYSVFPTPITYNAVPTISDGLDWQVLWLRNLHDSLGPIVIQDQDNLGGSNVQTFNDGDITLDPGETVMLQFSAADDDWIQMTYPKGGGMEFIDIGDNPIGTGVNKFKCGATLDCAEGDTPNIVEVDVNANYKPAYTAEELGDMGAVSINGDSSGDQDISQNLNFIGGKEPTIAGDPVRVARRYMWEMRDFDPAGGKAYFRHGYSLQSSSALGAQQLLGPCREVREISMSLYDYNDTTHEIGDIATLEAGKTVTLLLNKSGTDSANMCTLSGGTSHVSCLAPPAYDWLSIATVAASVECAAGCTTDSLAVVVNVLCY